MRWPRFRVPRVTMVPPEWVMEPARLTVWAVFSGCGWAHQDGMEAFLRLRGRRMEEPVLRLDLDLDYTRRAGILLDLRILLMTLRRLGPAGSN